jgi:uroporphyrinogen-III synthase
MSNSHSSAAPDRETRLAVALKSRRIVVTRPGDSGAALVQRLEQLGATAVHIPVIAFAAPKDSEALDRALDTLPDHDWMAFTSATAVRAIAKALAKWGTHEDALPRIAAVGSATAAAIEDLGWRVAFIPSTSSARAMAEEMPVAAGARVFLPAGELALPALAAGLRARMVHVTEVVAYRTLPEPGSAELLATLTAGPVDALTFTSPSTVMQFMLASTLAGWNAANAQRSGALQVVCIGATTAAAARAHGLQSNAVALEQSQEGLIDALASCLMTHGRPEHSTGEHHG